MRRYLVVMAALVVVIPILTMVLARGFTSEIPLLSQLFDGERESMDVKHLEMALGQKGDAIMARADFPVSRSSISTALLYRATAPDSKGIVVTLTQNGQQVQFPPARSVLFYGSSTDDVGTPQIGLSIKTPDKEYGETETLEEAKARARRTYDLVWGLIRNINNSGWKRYVHPISARLVGSVTYPLSEDRGIDSLNLVNYADPNYQLSWEQWQRIGEHVYIDWKWYTPGAFLTVTYSRGAVEAGWPVSSDLDVKVETEWSVLLGTGEQGDDLQAAKKHYAGKLPEFLKTRARKEAKARKLGLTILKDYQNPPIGGITIPDIEPSNG